MHSSYGNDNKQIYNPKDAKFLEEAEGSEALKWTKERADKTKNSFKSMSTYNQTSIKQLQ